MRTRSIAVFVLVVIFQPPELDAQRLSVAVSVQDSLAGGIFQSGFAAALRSLGDVDVVSLLEEPDYALSGVVLCTPSPCARAVRYSLALRLYEPPRRSTAEFLAQLALHPRSTAPIRDPPTDSLAASIWAAMEHREHTFMTWVVEWHPETYRRSISQLVAEIDSKCFDKLRALRRISRDRRESLSNQYARFQEFTASRDWLC